MSAGPHLRTPSVVCTELFILEYIRGFTLDLTSKSVKGVRIPGQKMNIVFHVCNTESNVGQGVAMSSFVRWVMVDVKLLIFSSALQQTLCSFNTLPIPTRQILKLSQDPWCHLLTLWIPLWRPFCCSAKCVLYKGAWCVAIWSLGPLTKPLRKACEELEVRRGWLLRVWCERWAMHWSKI